MLRGIAPSGLLAASCNLNEHQIGQTGKKITDAPEGLLITVGRYGYEFDLVRKDFTESMGKFGVET